MVNIETEEKIKKKQEKTPQANWYLVDAKEKILGRLATQVASLLMGKRKVSWQPHLDVGDNVVVINAKKVVVSGTKEKNKIYYRYSGYPGGLGKENFEHLLERKPQEVIYLAVKGMLPKTKLGRAMLKKLHVYEGEDHPHEAQKPEKFEV